MVNWEPGERIAETGRDLLPPFDFLISFPDRGDVDLVQIILRLDALGLNENDREAQSR